jgi:DNA polymerase-3 subunit delta
MKLNYSQLELHLAKQLAWIYIISGEELFLKQDAIQLIRKSAKRNGYNEHIRLAPEAGFDWEQLYSSLYARSLLAEKRLIEIDFRDSTPNKTASKILQEYAEKPASDTILLINMGKADDKITKSAWYKALEKTAIAIPVWPIPREQLPQWIQQRARKYKLQVQPDAANLLADFVEGNLIAAAQTIEKMYLLRLEKPLDADTIQTILSDESHFTVFDFIDSLIAGNKPRTLHILETLKTEGLEPVLILWGITRELRLLADYAQQIQQGCHYEQLFQKQRIFSRRQPAVRHFLNTHTAPDCWQYLKHATEIDQMIKGAALGNVWDSLQLLCLRML